MKPKTNVMPHTPDIWRCTNCEHVSDEKPKPNACPDCGHPMYRKLAVVVVN